MQLKTHPCISFGLSADRELHDWQSFSAFFAIGGGRNYGGHFEVGVVESVSV